MSLTAEALRVAFGEGYHVRIQMPIALDRYSEPEPDVAVVRGSPRDYREAHPSSPLLVLEVTDTTLAYDRDQKGSLYARAGIADYWVLNLAERCLEVYRDPAPSSQARYGWGYQTVRQYSSDAYASPLAAPRPEYPWQTCCLKTEYTARKPRMVEAFVSEAFHRI